MRQLDRESQSQEGIGSHVSGNRLAHYGPLNHEHCAPAPQLGSDGTAGGLYGPRTTGAGSRRVVVFEVPVQGTEQPLNLFIGAADAGSIVKHLYKNGQKCTALEMGQVESQNGPTLQLHGRPHFRVMVHPCELHIRLVVPYLNAQDGVERVGRAVHTQTCTHGVSIHRRQHDPHDHLVGASLRLQWA